MSGYRSKYFNDNRNDSNYGWYKCVHCGHSFRKDDIEIDHIIPQSRGGGDNINNLQCLCRSCNASKGNDVNDSARDLVKNIKRRYIK
ncbi:MAG: HNH endonuclease [Oscillospiraceae bacterium]|nr:HNH endonuclease [Oscillospiraceae bacterium]